MNRSTKNTLSRTARELKYHRQQGRRNPQPVRSIQSIPPLVELARAEAVKNPGQLVDAAMQSPAIRRAKPEPKAVSDLVVAVAQQPIPAKSLRTYYSYVDGVVSQRKRPGIEVAHTCRARNTEEANRLLVGGE